MSHCENPTFSPFLFVQDTLWICVPSCLCGDRTRLNPGAKGWRGWCVAGSASGWNNTIGIVCYMSREEPRHLAWRGERNPGILPGGGRKVQADARSALFGASGERRYVQADAVPPFSSLQASAGTYRRTPVPPCSALQASAGTVGASHLCSLRKGSASLVATGSSPPQIRETAPASVSSFHRSTSFCLNNCVSSSEPNVVLILPLSYI